MKRWAESPMPPSWPEVVLLSNLWKSSKVHKFSTYVFFYAIVDLMFRSLIHFEFIFVHGDRLWYSFTLLHMAFQFSQDHSLKRLFFFPSIACFGLLCEKFFAGTPVVLSLGCEFSSFGLCVCFSANTMLFWLSLLCSVVWSKAVWYLWLHSFFWGLLWQLRVFRVSM